MRYDAVIFDLDGTLTDSIRDLGTAVNHALSIHGLPLRRDEEFPGLVGHGVRNLVKNSLPIERASDEVFTDAVLADFTDYYSSNIDVYTRPYPGIPELLRDLSAGGTALAVASNKFQSGTEHLVSEFFPDIDWLCVNGNRPGAPLKPDPAIVGNILEVLKRHVGKQDSRGISCVLVGDSATDIRTAHNGGIPAIAVTWGYRPESDLHEAEHIAHNVQELRDLLL